MEQKQTARDLLEAVFSEGRERGLTYLAGLPEDAELFPMDRGQGTTITDEYGEQYLDFSCGDHLLFGHLDPAIGQRILVQLQHHTYQGPYGAYQERLVSEYAQALSGWFPPGKDEEPRQVMFTSSVYEARMAAAHICVDPPSKGSYFLSLLDVEGHPRDGGEVQDEVHRARAQGLRIVADELDTGFGITGTFCLYEQYSVNPDVVLMGRAGCAGLSQTAVIAPRSYFQTPAAANLFDHIAPSPCPLACAAGAATLDRLNPDVIQRIANFGELFASELGSVCGQFDHVLTGTVGVGLVRTIRLNAPSQRARFRQACREAGLLIKPNLRLVPPLTVTDQQVKVAVDAIAAACIGMEQS